MVRCLGFLAFFIVFPVLAYGKGQFITPNIEMVGKRLHIAGKTNLPDGSRIFITVVGKSSPFMAQGDAVVRNGSFDGGAYGPVAGFRDGSYHAELSALKPGPPANEWHTAKDLMETTVKLTIKGGRIGKFNERSVTAAKHRALQFAKKLSAMEKQGRKMDQFRSSPILEDIATCSRMMHKLQPVADEYQRESDGLPSMEVKVPLGAAAIELKMCVSCSDNAVEHCNRAKEYIAEGIKQAKSDQ
ncbi:hypothetical protein [Geomesophilobacter sediminis]|uniref:Uncharacterized protein n=1 Tax=Geomesophilobacter sediminis TaxID=2798584 RepID=A0A8J7M191_9BACT|nr:hypothetical protein [Geomesophilobacter sediminis]MBJ6726815.1 hypothetical protein [Geomesophilobacter sediminis]